MKIMPPRQPTARTRVERPVRGSQGVAVAPGASEATGEALGALLRAVRPRKYRNTPTIVDGHRFDSKREAARYEELRNAERAGEIRSLEVHPRFPLVVHGIDCGAYVADFAFVARDGQPIVEDVKSAATRKLPTYRLKARMLWALYAIKIREVM
jgi:hypothetical protein